MAAVALTAQNTSDAIINPVLQFLGPEADKEYTRSKRLRDMNFHSVIAIAMRPSAQRAIAKTTCTLCDASHTKTDQGGGKRRGVTSAGHGAGLITR